MALVFGATAANAVTNPAGTPGTPIPAGSNPYAVAYDPDNHTVYVTNNADGTVTPIDATTNTVGTAIPAGSNPYAVVYDPDNHTVYVTNNTNGTVTPIDATTNMAGTPIRAGAYPFGVAYDPDNHTLYVTNAENGTVTPIDATTNTAGTPISAGSSPNEVAYDPDNHTIYVANSNTAGTVTPIDATTNTPGTPIHVGTYPHGVVYDPDNHLLYVANFGGGTVTPIDATTNTAGTPIPAGAYPFAVAYDPANHTLYVTNDPAGTVTPIDATTNTVGTPIHVGTAPYGVAYDPDNRTVYVANGTGTVTPILVPPVDRVAGADRYATSVAISQAAYPDGASVVYLASGLNFPDALGAVPAAVRDHAPLLLTGTTLPASVQAEITRLHPDKILIVGQTGAVPAAVETALKPLAASVVRIGGVDRFDTDKQIIQNRFGSTTSTVFLASGMNFPDALSAGAAAGSKGEPVLLINGAQTGLDASTTAFLTGQHVTGVTIVGGTGAVSQGTQNALTKAGITVTRQSGADRYATSLAIGEAAFPAYTHAYLASGMNFPDALGGSVLAGAKGAPLFTSTPTCVPAAIATAIKAQKITELTLLGGTGTLSPAVATLTPCP